MQGSIDLVLTGEAARILDVSVDTVRRWTRCGRLPALSNVGRYPSLRPARGGGFGGQALRRAPLSDASTGRTPDLGYDLLPLIPMGTAV